MADLDDLEARIEQLEERLSRMAEPFCMDTGDQSLGGVCVHHHGDACLRTGAGLVAELMLSRQEFERIKQRVLHKDDQLARLDAENAKLKEHLLKRHGCDIALPDTDYGL